MCHLLLAVPIIGLLAFAFLPLSQAIAIDLPLSAISLGLFYIIYRDTKRPKMVGRESLVGDKGSVVSRREQPSAVLYMVRCQGELWSATSRDNLDVGEQVRVLSLDGDKLVVRRFGVEPQVTKSSHCH